MIILITGGCGYIGSHLVLSLLELNYKIIVIDNLSNSNKNVLNRIENYIKEINPNINNNITFYENDIRDFDALNNIFNNHQITHVIHLAALKSVNKSISEPINYYDNNINGTITLLKVMDKYNCKNMIYSSSATVYGHIDKCPIPENAVLKTQTSPYGHSKLIIEQMLEQLSKSSKIISLRYFNPVGSHHSLILGDNPIGIPENLMPYIVKVIAGELPYLQIFGNKYPTIDGTCIRDFIHIMDLVDGHIKALLYLDNMPTNYDVFNLGTGKGKSIMEIIDCFKLMGINVKYQIADKRPGDIPSVYADVKKAKRILGWQSKYVLADMCKSAWQHYQFIKQKNE